MHEISYVSVILRDERFTEQVGPRADSDAARLSAIDLIVASDPQTGQLGFFGGFFIRRKEH
jgi:hypothetical protein